MKYTIKIDTKCKILKNKSLLMKALDCLPSDTEILNIDLTHGSMDIQTSALPFISSELHFEVTESVILTTTPQMKT